jgi:Xaa-Pro aminopeptidase
MHTQAPVPPEMLRPPSGSPPGARFCSRIASVVGKMSEQPAITLLVSDPAWVRYLCGFHGSNGSLVLSIDGKAPHYLCTDGRYHVAAIEALAAGGLEGVVEVSLTDPLAADVTVLRPPIAILGRQLSLAGLRRLLSLDPAVADAEALLWPIRARKDASEIALMRRAASIADDALDAALTTLGEESASERDLAARFEWEARRRGADGAAFETIVATNARAALPHAVPSDHAIRPGDLLLVDFGAVVGGYRSDATRTLAVGTELTGQRRHHWEIVAEAQQAGIAAARPGALATDVERAVRAVLASAGVEDLLLHGVGHGVGLDIHERPFTSRDETPLAEGMVLTVEPGIYLAGSHGIRLEDTIVIQGSGACLLTRPARAHRTVGFRTDPSS